jgi:hypothetical protein
MIPTVEQVKDRAAYHLGDPTRRKFTHEKLQEAFASAFEEIYTHLLNYQISTVELIATYTLTGGTTTLAPATASIAKKRGRTAQPRTSWMLRKLNSYRNVTSSPTG